MHRGAERELAGGAVTAASPFHANWAVTAEHYARWVPNAECINPPRLGKGDVWPDVLACLEPVEGGGEAAARSEGA